MEQRFTLPDLPLHRELQAPVSIGTQFSVRATPIELDLRTLTLALVTRNSEAALEIYVLLPDSHGRGAKLYALSRSALAESARQEKEASTVAIHKELILGIIIKEHVFEIYLDTVFLLSFVHRVNPSEITSIVLDGAIICSEVVIIPAKADMPLLPAYSELQPGSAAPLYGAPQQQQLQPDWYPSPPVPPARPPPPQQHTPSPQLLPNDYRRASSQEPMQQLQSYVSTYLQPHCRRGRGLVTSIVSAALERRGRGWRDGCRGFGGGRRRHASSGPPTSHSWTCFENMHY